MNDLKSRLAEIEQLSVVSDSCGRVWELRCSFRQLANSVLATADYRGHLEHVNGSEMLTSYNFGETHDTRCLASDRAIADASSF